MHMKTWFKHSLPVLPGLLTFLLAPWPARAQATDGPQLYAVTFTNRQLLTLDTNTGAGTLILTNLPYKPFDLTVFKGSLYLFASGTAGAKLTAIHPETGAILRETVFTNRDIAGGEGACDFLPDGVAVAAKANNTIGTLFRLEMFSTNLDLITPEDGLSPSLDGLASDSNGVLYGLSQGGGGRHSLYIVNTNSGETALVGDLGIIFPTDGLSVAGLAFAPDGTLYAALGASTNSLLCRVDKATGAATPVGLVGFSGISGIRFFKYEPPPGPLAVRLGRQEVRISWPPARGGVLEWSPSVEGGWSAADLSVSTNGTEAVVLAPAVGAQGFFRLRR